MLDLSFKVDKVVSERSKNYPDHSHAQSELHGALLGRELGQFQQSAWPFDTIGAMDLSWPRICTIYQVLLWYVRMSY